MRVAMLIYLLCGTSVAAATEIYRCPLENGTFAFQERPCLEPAENSDDNKDIENPAESQAPAAKDDAFDFVNPFDEPAEPATDFAAELPEPVSQDRAECEKTTRDAIDAIDLEMRASTYSKEQAKVYLTELRALTQQLRACKQL